MSSIAIFFRIWSVVFLGLVLYAAFRAWTATPEQIARFFGPGIARRAVRVGAVVLVIVAVVLLIRTFSTP